MASYTLRQLDADLIASAKQRALPNSHPGGTGYDDFMISASFDAQRGLRAFQ